MNMERFFEVTKSKLGKEYVEHKENSRLVHEAFKEFCGEYGIGAKEYVPCTERLMLVPTVEDKEKFKSSLCKTVKENGVVSFRTSSKINKAWVEKVKDIKLTSTSMLIFGNFCILGRHLTRLFKIDDKVYFSVSGDDYDIKNLKVLEGMNEMKASEFFKIIEDYEEKCNEVDR